jgi:phosphoribosylformylglycinamidine (FGAM) synthase-like enzyme
VRVSLKDDEFSRSERKAAPSSYQKRNQIGEEIQYKWSKSLMNTKIINKQSIYTSYKNNVFIKTIHSSIFKLNDMMIVLLSSKELKELSENMSTRKNLRILMKLFNLQTDQK